MLSYGQHSGQHCCLTARRSRVQIWVLSMQNLHVLHVSVWVFSGFLPLSKTCMLGLIVLSVPLTKGTGKKNLELVSRHCTMADQLLLVCTVNVNYRQLCQMQRLNLPMGIIKSDFLLLLLFITCQPVCQLNHPLSNLKLTLDQVSTNLKFASVVLSSKNVNVSVVSASPGSFCTDSTVGQQCQSYQSEAFRLYKDDDQ